MQIDSSGSISVEEVLIQPRFRCAEAIRTLNPGYFAIVMGTGIVSIASNLLGISEFARCLLALNILFFLLMWMLTLARILLFRQDFWHDLTDHKRGVGFFTAVAGTGVLGTQLILLAKTYPLAWGTAWALWILSLLLWLSLTYTIFTSFTIKETKPTLEEGINGAWLLSVVATQSVCILGNLLVPTVKAENQHIMLFVTLVLWLCGGMLYIWLIALIFYRYNFFKFLPTDFAPPYWINMGAVSISTLAGTRLIDNAPDWSFLTDIVPFVKGFTLLFWATGTWWLPMLFILAIWRHAWKRVPVAYDCGYWGLVFPLGMYTAATFRLSSAIGLPFLQIIPRCFIYLAILAWVITFIGFIRRVAMVVQGRYATL